jgi:hypothetical protein
MALQVTTAATGVVRDAHYVTPTGASAAVRTLLLEPQRTNLVTRSQEINLWSDNNVGTTVTANAAVAPDGTTTADLLSGDGTAVSQGKLRGAAFTGDGTKVFSVFLKEGTGDTRVVMQVGDLTAGVTRRSVRVTWTAGVPSLTSLAGAGTLYPIEAYTNGWYRIAFAVDSIVAANSNALVALTANGAAVAGSMYIWGAQAEDAVVPSSYIPTAATTVTRNADSLYWALASLVPREMTVYVRTINLGIFSTSSNRLLQIGLSSNAFAAFSRNAATTNFLMYQQNSAAVSRSSSVSFAAAVLFDVIEMRGVLAADGAVTLGGSINAGAETVGAASAALALEAAFSSAQIYLAGLSGGTTFAPCAFTNVAISLGTKSRTEMRAIAGVT